MRTGAGLVSVGEWAGLLIALLASGCITVPSAAAQRVKVADPAEVVACKLVADVHGSSGWGNLAASTGMQNAKNEALEQAASAGATHIVWTNVAGGYSPFATGKAYRCN